MIINLRGKDSFLNSQFVWLNDIISIFLYSHCIYKLTQVNKYLYYKFINKNITVN